MTTESLGSRGGKLFRTVCQLYTSLLKLSMLTIIKTDYQPPVLMALARCLATALVTSQ